MTPSRQICALGILLALTRFASAAPVLFTVEANVPQWQATGFQVTAGQTVRITATGLTHPDEFSFTDANAVGFSTVHGPSNGTFFHPESLVPQAIYCSLVGKVGGSASLGTGSLLPEGMPGRGPGFVGTNYEKVVPFSGELFFAYNDAVNFNDNSGSYSVSVEIVPEPAGLWVLALAAVMSRRRGAKSV